jgi:hypothetical protein
MGIVAEAAVGYARAGYFTIVDGIISPEWFLGPVSDAFRAAGFQVAYAVLRPSLQASIDRAGGRPSNNLADPGVIEQLWHSFADLGPLEPHAIDNSTQTPEETAAQLADRLRLGTLTV